MECYQCCTIINEEDIGFAIESYAGVYFCCTTCHEEYAGNDSH